MEPRARPPALERRQTPRFRVRRGRLRGHSLEARLIDFSPGGLGLETHNGLRIGATYRFRLFAGRGRPIAATVRWCRLERTDRHGAGEVRPVYRAGLRLLEQGPPLPRSGQVTAVRVSHLDPAREVLPPAPLDPARDLR